MVESLGCKHYQRKCEIQAPCCQLWYSCRLCHDENFQGFDLGCLIERMERKKISKIRCLLCKEEQAPSQICVKCNIEFSKYYCDTCRLFDNTPGKKIYHCEKCDMCRIGKRSDNFHCDTCGICMHTSLQNRHKCIQDIVDRNCPICLENLKHSTQLYQCLEKCGHWIHQSCLSNYMCDIYLIEQEIKAHMDKEFFPKELLEKKVDIVCNECMKKSVDLGFNPLGIKCANCGTYNTDIISNKN